MVWKIQHPRNKLVAPYSRTQKTKGTSQFALECESLDINMILFNIPQSELAETYNKIFC